MGKLLIRIFVKDYENTTEPGVRESYGKLAGAVGIASNAVLCIMKIVIGLVTHSIAIVADGINNLADASSSVITLVGFRLAAAPEDKEHPYGHARIEYISGLFVSVLIIVLGLQLLRSSAVKVLHPDPLVFHPLTVVILVIAIGIKIWQAVFNISIGRRIDSIALRATGTDSRNDVIATTVVLISIIAGKLAGIQLDGMMGCMVALFIICSGVQLIRETTSPLLGEAPDEELVRAIAREALSHDGVLGIHDLVVHNYGPGKIFASIHIEVDARGDLMESHDMIDNIERGIMDKLKIQFTAHMDPIEKDNPRIKQLTEVIRDCVEPIEGITGIHDLRLVPGPTHTNIIFDAVLTPNCKLDEDRVKTILEKEVQKLDPSYFVVITFDRAYTDL